MTSQDASSTSSPDSTGQKREARPAWTDSANNDATATDGKKPTEPSSASDQLKLPEGFNPGRRTSHVRANGRPDTVKSDHKEHRRSATVSWEALCAGTRTNRTSSGQEERPPKLSSGLSTIQEDGKTGVTASTAKKPSRVIILYSKITPGFDHLSDVVLCKSTNGDRSTDFGFFKDFMGTGNTVFQLVCLQDLVAEAASTSGSTSSGARIPDPCPDFNGVTTVFIWALESEVIPDVSFAHLKPDFVALMLTSAEDHSLRWPHLYMLFHAKSCPADFLSEVIQYHVRRSGMNDKGKGSMDLSSHFKKLLSPDGLKHLIYGFGSLSKTMIQRLPTERYLVTEDGTSKKSYVVAIRQLEQLATGHKPLLAPSVSDGVFLYPY